MTIKDFAVQKSLERDMIASAELVYATLSSIASSNETINTEFENYINNILQNAGIYVEDPGTYAEQIVSAIRVVAEIPGQISSKLLAYQVIIDNIASQEIEKAIQENKNILLINELVGTAVIVAASESVNQALNNTSTIARDSKGRTTITVPDADTGFQTREEILSAVVYLRTNFINLVNALDLGQDIFEDLLLSDSYIQTIQSYVPAWKVVSTTIIAALEASFSLPLKRILKIYNSRTILDLCFKLYKNIDDTVLDFFILTNNLTGDSVIEVPINTEVVYYE